MKIRVWDKISLAVALFIFCTLLVTNCPAANCRVQSNIGANPSPNPSPPNVFIGGLSFVQGKT
jgi:hypothetical protein